MDIEALIKNLEAVNDSLQSPKIRESDDFKKCVERFQAKLADLIGVYKTSNRAKTADLKIIVSDLKAVTVFPLFLTSNFSALNLISWEKLSKIINENTIVTIINLLFFINF